MDVSLTVDTESKYRIRKMVKEPRGSLSVLQSGVMDTTSD